MVTQELELPLSPTALLTRCRRQPFVFALDGGGPGSWGTGYALLGFRPCATLRVAADGTALVCEDGTARRWQGDPFALLDRFRAHWAPPQAAPQAARAGGVIAALSYDLRHWVARRRGGAAVPADVPVLHAAAYDWLLAYGYAARRYRLASWRCSPAELRRVAAQLIELAAMPAQTDRQAACAAAVRRPAVRSNLSVADYTAAVQAGLAYIAAGDVYQVNLAQRFEADSARTPAALYAALQRCHPVPFAGYVDGGDFVLVSNSPECFLALRDGTLATFPIKGTRRRGDDPVSDAALARQLREDPKERAEHVMIVDLERNDLGRVCRTGSVRVEEFARVHSFPSVHHLVSKVAGSPPVDVALADILRATFPGGSITGAPKIRAMEVIAEIEPVERGFYAGAIGFLGLDGGALFNLAIRTAVVTAGGVTYHAGGGIVADSVPAREYEETLLKAQAFFAALGTA